VSTSVQHESQPAAMVTKREVKSAARLRVRCRSVDDDMGGCLPSCDDAATPQDPSRSLGALRHESAQIRPGRRRRDRLVPLFEVLDDGTCEGAAAPSTPTAPASKTVITVPESQDLAIGTTGAVYPVMISNLGSTAKTYTLTATGAESWGTVRFDPGAVVIVQPESVKTVYMYVAANENAQAGAQVFKLSVDGQGESKQVLLSANVKDGVAKSYDGLRRGLEIGLIVLVIVLIILGLIIGFNKLRGGKDDEEDSQTYY
jgi:uncharacterized membrane protein